MFVSGGNICDIPPVAAHTNKDGCTMINDEKTACHYTCEPGFELPTGEFGQFIFCTTQSTEGSIAVSVKEWETLSPCEGLNLHSTGFISHLICGIDLQISMTE